MKKLTAIFTFWFPITPIVLNTILNKTVHAPLGDFIILATVVVSG